MSSCYQKTTKRIGHIRNYPVNRSAYGLILVGNSTRCSRSVLLVQGFRPLGGQMYLFEVGIGGAIGALDGVIP